MPVMPYTSLYRDAPGAAALVHRISRELDQGYVEDYGVVRMYDLEIIRDIDDADNDDYEEDPREEDASEEDENEDGFDLREWWGQFARQRQPGGRPGFRRCGLLLVTDEERREDCRLIGEVRRTLGRDHVAHWHGRNSIFLTFWHDQEIATVLQGSSLGRLVRSRNSRGVYGFELTNDCAAKHVPSTLAAWFDRGPGSGGPPKIPPRRPRPSGGDLPRLSSRAKVKSFQVETRTRRR